MRVAPAAGIFCSNGASSANPAQKIKKIFAHQPPVWAPKRRYRDGAGPIHRPEPEQNKSFRGKAWLLKGVFGQSGCG